MADRDTVTVTLFHGSSDICYSLPDAVAWLTELLEDVPEGHHEGVIILDVPTLKA